MTEADRDLLELMLRNQHVILKALLICTDDARAVADPHGLEVMAQLHLADRETATALGLDQ